MKQAYEKTLFKYVEYIMESRKDDWTDKDKETFILRMVKAFDLTPDEHEYLNLKYNI